MKPAFLLMCYLAGAPAGTLHFQSVKTADYFKSFLDNQTIKIGEEEKKGEIRLSTPEKISKRLSTPVKTLKNSDSSKILEDISFKKSEKYLPRNKSCINLKKRLI